MKINRIIPGIVVFILAASCSQNTQQPAITKDNQSNRIVLKTELAKDTISKHIYGHFAEHLGRCIYDGIWVGEKSSIANIKGIRKDVFEALKELNIPVLRWPGGCYADIYQWRNGIGPKEKRPHTINIFWGDVVDDNSFGTHEFLDFCEMLGTEPYIAVNVGSGTVEDAANWIEYVTSGKDTEMTRLRKQNGRKDPWNVKFWGIGNESWGCGGNMEADYYTDLFKQYATFCKGSYLVASGGLGHDLNWTETVMKKTKAYQQLIQGYSYHHYTVAHDWEKKGPSTGFPEEDWFLTLSKNLEMEENLVSHMNIMEKFDPDKKIALIADEWGNWHDSEPGTNGAFLYQQNTLRDALTAGIYLNIFNRHCDRVKMANIAQTVNVLQAMVLTNGELMVKTPTFYTFKMYKVHFDALHIPVDLTCTRYTYNDKSIPSLSVSASADDQGRINVTIVNVNPHEKAVTSILTDKNDQLQVVSASIITGPSMDSLNDFGKDENVNLQDFSDFKVDGQNLQVTLPVMSVVQLTLSTKQEK